MKNSDTGSAAVLFMIILAVTLFEGEPDLVDVVKCKLDETLCDYEAMK